MSAAPKVTSGEPYPTILRAYDRIDSDVVEFSEHNENAVSRTKQSFKDECDINHILRTWKATGIIDHVVRGKPSYLDFDTPDDYMDALNKIEEARETFESLPADVRVRFNNDPVAMLSFVSDAANHDEARDLGLLVPQETPTPESPVSSDSSPSAPPAEGTPGEVNGTD